MARGPVWRNGRRDRLKLGCPQGRVGSTPTTGTTELSERVQEAKERMPRTRGIRSSISLLFESLDDLRVRVGQRLYLLGRAQVDVGRSLLVELGRHLERAAGVVHLRLAIEERERHDAQHDE